VRLDVFCRVVDNFGDAGVAWRLARQLAAEHGVEVTLWIDAPATLVRMVEGFDPARAAARHQGVRIERLGDAADTAVDALPAMVVEAFGCGLPPAYLQRMAAAPAQPAWINLEYLSAEPWIESVHGLPSPHPRLPLTRHFFFPGFTPATGGLLRERDLFARRDAARAGPAGARPFTLSLFCYPNPALPALLDAWSAGDAMLCRVPEGVATAAMAAWLGRPPPPPGGSTTRGRLTIETAPFGTQDDYDRLLWDCDLNFVRGEDSFVRAQWAARPLAWHAYPQSGDAHLVKLDAFLDRYAAGLAPDAAATLRAFFHAWNRGDGPAAAAAWPALQAAQATLRDHAERWSAAVGALPDLAGNLLDFGRNRL